MIYLEFIGGTILGVLIGVGIVWLGLEIHFRLWKKKFLKGE